MERSPIDRSRREVLRMGAFAVTGAVALMGCSSDDPAPEADPDAAGEERTRGRETSGPEVDLGLLNTALSLEVLAIDTYQVAFDHSLIATSAVVRTATLLQEHHREHRDALIAAVAATGGEPFTTANPVVKAALVDPSLVSITVERDFIALARDLEHAAAQLYVHAATGLSRQELRSIAMAIGAVASRHATILDLLGDLGNERLATFPTENPLPSDAIVSG